MPLLHLRSAASTAVIRNIILVTWILMHIELSSHGRAPQF